MYIRGKRVGEAMYIPILAHLRWTLLYILWNILVSCYMTVNMMKIFQGYHCVADVLLFSQNPWNCGVLYMIFSMLYINKKEMTVYTPQRIVNSSSRSKIWNRKIGLAIISSMSCTFTSMASLVLSGKLFSLEWINWSQPDSVFNGYTGATTTLSFIVVIVGCILMTFLKTFLNAEILMCINLSNGYKFLFWIFLLLPIGIERSTDKVKMFYHLFATPYLFWTRPERIWGIILIGIGIGSAIWLIGKRFVQTKDFFF